MEASGPVELRESCREKRCLGLFKSLEATFIKRGCGARINAGPGVTRSEDEVAVSSQDRSVPDARAQGQLYPRSPYSVAASAIAGFVTQWNSGRAIELVAPRQLVVV